MTQSVRSGSYDFLDNGDMSKTAYILGNRINRGGMAEIYLGKAVGDDNFEKLCAIKRILPHHADDKEYIKMFRDEAHICKRLQHANIVQVTDYAVVDGSPSLIMEFVDGVDLRTLLSTCEGQKIKIPVPMVIYILAGAARGLHYAHTRTDEFTGKHLEIIHRDISPQNILLNYEGEAKVTDFGIASASAENKIAETKAGVVKGKYSYMSPEQIAAKKLDARSDVFSLAVVLWEALAMKRLFYGVNEIETIKKVQECIIPQNLRELNQEVTNELAQIVLKGLAADRKKRYQSAGAFESDLTKYLHNKYPNFGVQDLSEFLKNKLTARRMETSDHVKQTLAIPSVAATENPDNKRTEYNPEHSSQDLTKSKVQLELSTVSHLPLSNNFNSQHSPTTNQTTTKFSNKRPEKTEAKNSVTLRSRHGTKLQANAEFHASRKTRHSKWSTMIKVFSAMAAVLFIGILITQQLKFPDKKTIIKIKTIPAVVLIDINDKPFNKGAFVHTPIKLALSGKMKSTVTIKRPGYHSFNYDVDPSTTLRARSPLIDLQRKSSAILIPVKIKSTDHNLIVNVDNGFYIGPTPKVIDEMSVYDTHLITLVSKEKSSSPKAILQCKFKTPERKQGGRIFTVSITQRKQSLECKAGFD